MNLAELGKGERRALDDARRNDALGWVFGPSRTVRKRDLLKLIERGLVRECSTTAVVVDGDGFIKHPVRFVRAYELTELGKEVARAAELEDEAAMKKLYAENKAQKETIESLRAAVRAADAMARALLDKSNGAHECNGGPERCWHCADAESDRAVVSAYDQARAKCGEVT